jgi:microcystin-dependent protein
MEGYFGQVMLFAGSFAPRNWMFCDGQMMDIAQNPALFSILGTTYGGDGVHTFKLPDTKARDAEGMRHVICVNGIYPSRW